MRLLRPPEFRNAAERIHYALLLRFVQQLNLSDLVDLVYYEQEQALYARWPDNDLFMPRDFQYTFTLVMNTISRFRVTNLIIDSGSNYNNLSEADYRYISELLFSGLMHVGIRKVARIYSPYAGIEENFRKYNQQVRAEMGTGFELQNFANLEGALNWLRAATGS